MSATFKVDEVTPTKSGNAWRVRSGARWFNAFKDSGIELCKGKLIEAEITTHEKYGDGIAKYKVIEAPSAPTQGPEYVIRPQGKDLGPVSVAPYWQTFVSNQVASAIQAGLIKEPQQLKEWTFAAMNAIKGAVEGDIGI